MASTVKAVPQRVSCGYCGEATDMGATRLCDNCYEVIRRLARFLAKGGPEARDFVRHHLETADKKVDGAR